MDYPLEEPRPAKDDPGGDLIFVQAMSFSRCFTRHVVRWMEARPADSDVLVSWPDGSQKMSHRSRQARTNSMFEVSAHVRLFFSRLGASA